MNLDDDTLPPDDDLDVDAYEPLAINDNENNLATASSNIFVLAFSGDLVSEMMPYTNDSMALGKMIRQEITASALPWYFTDEAVTTVYMEILSNGAHTKTFIFTRLFGCIHRQDIEDTCCFVNMLSDVPGHAIARV